MREINKYSEDLNIRDWDTKFFGYKVANCSPKTAHDLYKTEDLAYAGNEPKQKVKLLMVRCGVENMEVIDALICSKFILMETQVSYSFSFSKNFPYPTTPIRVAVPDDLERLKEIAKVAFKDYGGHFHNDRKIDSDKATDMYVEWIANSCFGNKLADEVFVTEDLNGFITVKKLNDTVGEGVLACVDKKAQHRGIYKDLILTAMIWGRDNGLKSMEMTTRVNNFAVQKVWQRIGWEIFEANHTFHKWL